MKQRKSTIDLQKHLNQLKEDIDTNEKYLDNLKKQLSKEIKTNNPKDIKNTLFIEKEYTLWERIKKVLGIG